MPLHYAATEEDAQAAGLEMKNPFAADDSEALARGQAVFQKYCVACHGGSGNGDGPVAMRGFPPPPSFATGKSRQMADGGLFHILTYGRGNMPPHAGLVSREDRWKVILHVRRLAEQAVSSVPSENSESPESGSPSAEAARSADAEGDAS
jgi:mono/diheme cytochrome c family protein